MSALVPGRDARPPRALNAFPPILNTFNTLILNIASIYRLSYTYRVCIIGGWGCLVLRGRRDYTLVLVLILGILRLVAWQFRSYFAGVYIDGRTILAVPFVLCVLQRWWVSRVADPVGGSSTHCTVPGLLCRPGISANLHIESFELGPNQTISSTFEPLLRLACHLFPPWPRSPNLPKIPNATHHAQSFNYAPWPRG